MWFRVLPAICWQSVTGEISAELNEMECRPLAKGNSMAANDNPEDQGKVLAGLKSELDALTARVVDLEATLRHEHDDLLRLREEAKADHRKLEDLKDTTGGGSSSSPVTPLGL